MLVLLGLLALTSSTEIGIDPVNMGQMNQGFGVAPRRLCPQHSKIYGPGLNPQFHVPVRYFYIQAVDSLNQNFTVSLGKVFKLKITASDGAKVRAWYDLIDRGDGIYLARYRLFEELDSINIEVTLIDNKAQVAQSPYMIAGLFYNEGCACSEPDTEEWTKRMSCKANYTQVDLDINQFADISVIDLPSQVKKKFDSHYSLGHYVIKDNRIYSNMIGEHTGLNRKFEDMLISLISKVNLPDLEFFVNLRDKPVEKGKIPMPILSFVGSRDTADIAMPSYELTHSMLYAMHKADTDLLGVPGDIGPAWSEKIPLGFWRGRDSREQRLDLCRLSRGYPDKIDAKLTQSLFFSHVPSLYGEIAKKVPFKSFFDYKYQISLDGIVAAFRVPFVMAGSSVLFKQDSFFYEHFYADLEPWVHYIPFNHNLNNLIQRINWAIDNDHLAHIIAENGRHFIRTQLNPSDIYCYMFRLLERYSQKQYGKIAVRKDMHELFGKRTCQKCPYNPLRKAEL